MLLGLTTNAQSSTDSVRSELNYYLERHNVRDEGFDMVARYAEEGDSTLTAYRSQGPHLLTNYVRPRRGKSIVVDPYGRPILATFNADTLVCGIRIDTLGTYAGMFNQFKEACGHGSFRSTKGSYYEGEWLHDQREQFGFEVASDYLKAGQWHQDRFLGERMLHTTERIYGIDISRYQHEQGRKKYSINWRNLRITRLSRRIAGEQLIDGQTDYPVSFVYIKSTEGISIVNQYFAADYQAAHKQQIPVGAYHFFSTRQTPREQAAHFLLNTRFRRGDLPPMLDIEPSDALINAMGGPEALFESIRVWLDIVERATHVRPILYVNQRFVNKFLDLAPDLKSGYHFWIARYGEYKPDLHLALWQLSPEGRVSGIQGDVDINVFNGYQGQWDSFLHDDCIP
mgnify:FL=1